VTELARHFPQIVAELETAVSIVSRLFGAVKDFQKLGVVSPGRESVEPVAAIEMAIRMCKGTAYDARARTTYDGPSELPRVLGSSVDLLQIFVNLVTNAQQAIGAKGTGGNVTVEARHEGDWVRFAVRDDGTGMGPDVLAKVGTPFFTTRETGVGLGVAQCRRLVGRLGGRLCIDSKLGAGTTVTLALPVAPKR
jgi:two-component system NtrC family sensor kinase